MERTVLRWGGLAGVVGGVVFIVIFVIVALFVGNVSPDPNEVLQTFPEIQEARTVENGLYLAVLILWVVHFLALYRASGSRTSRRPSLGVFWGSWD